MAKLIDILPDLARELVASLRSVGNEEVADQIDSAVVRTVSFDAEANAGYVALEPSRQLNVVEANVIGVRLPLGQTIPVETQFWTTIAMDNFGRVVGIEILSPGALKSELERGARA